LKTNYTAIAVASRGGILVTALTGIGPVIKIVGTPDLIHFCVQRIGAGEGKALTGTHRVALTVASGFAFSLAYRYHGGVAVFGSVHTVMAGRADGKGLVGGVDFEHIVTVKFPKAHVHASGAQLNLNGAVIEIEKTNTGISANINRGRAQLNFGTGIAVGP
jgi:hypothetical protein